MRKKGLWIFIGLIVSSAAWAGETDVPSPAATPVAAVGGATLTPSPTPVLISAPPGLKPAEIATPYPKKPSPWLSLTGIGVGLPLSPNLKSAYSTAFNLDLGAGYLVSRQLSLWLDVALALYDSKNDSLTQGNNFTLIDAALWTRFRILDSDFSPFLLAGPGLAYNENRSNSVEILDPNTGDGYIPINAYEVDFLAEGGLGLDLRMGDGASLFLQAKITYDFTSGHFAGFAFTDSPLVVMPVEAGVIFGL